MIKISKPEIDQSDIIDACTSNMRKGMRLNNIIASRNTIKQKSKKYDNIAEKGKLFLVREHSNIEGGATRDDMVWLYDSKFVKDGGRTFYSKIMSIPPYGTCPFCGQRKVSTLDHYLPKTKFPVYAITPYNLVAACSDCNRIKSDETAKSRLDETIHPYYDDFDDEIWIKASVIENEPLGFSFYVDKPCEWNELKCKRAKKHFEVYNLNKLYSSHAAEEYAEYSFSAKKLYSKGKDKLVIEDLKERIESCRSIRLNTWKAAMYSALLESNWYFEMLHNGTD